MKRFLVCIKKPSKGQFLDNKNKEIHKIEFNFYLMIESDNFFSYQEQ